MNEMPGWLKNATVWLVLAAAVFLGVQAWMNHERATRFSVEGGTLALRRSADGHYHWPGSVAGRPVDFLIDTGATGTAIPAAMARELGLAVVGPLQSQTAGGVAYGSVVLADVQLQGGVSAARLRVAALPHLQAPLLGMDVLGKLRWRQDQGVLRVEMLPLAP
jgi:aspartyl protease family protein